MEAENIKQNNPLGHEPVSSLLRRFGIPSIVAMVVSALYNIVDQIFIGHGVGYLGNAATNVAFPITNIVLAAGLLTGVGGAARFSLELGAKRDKEAAKTVGSMVWMGLVLGIVICALVQSFLTPLLRAFGATDNVIEMAKTYTRITGAGIPFLLLTNVLSNIIRADGSPRYSMMCMVVGAIANTILDPIAIFLLDMGVAGAAWATLISQIISCAMAVVYLKKIQSVTMDKAAWKPSIKLCGNIASLGMGSSINQLGLILVQVALNNSLTHYGALSIYGADIPLSGAGVVMKINSIFVGVFIGLSQGSQPILGFNYGARQFDRVRATYKLAIKCALCVSVTAFLLFQIFPEAIISLFGAGDALYMEFTVRFMRTFLFCIFLNCVQPLSSAFFSAIGKAKRGILLSLSRQVLFLMPLMLLFPLINGIDSLLYCAPVADICALLLSCLLVYREFKRMKKMEAELLCD